MTGIVHNERASDVLADYEGQHHIHDVESGDVATASGDVAVTSGDVAVAGGDVAIAGGDVAVASGDVTGQRG